MVMIVLVSGKAMIKVMQITLVQKDRQVAQLNGLKSNQLGMDVNDINTTTSNAMPIIRVNSDIVYKY